ncbi:hypothetical protein MKX33_03095 [Paenibacillus sp. FSL R5-0490]|uniref:hypothetical protein n=1 Tax=Paenibacillus sp. FSL R5-0490 TaxID=1920424 RepID=UPI0030CC1683
MKIWTVQNDFVIRKILEDGFYKPDFSKSDGLGSKRMKKLYSELLDLYKVRNKIECKGLVFCLNKLDNKNINTIDDYNNYFYSNPFYSDSVSSCGDNYSILEIDVDNSFDQIPILFQDFIILAHRAIGDFDYLNYIKPELRHIPINNFEFDLKISNDIEWVLDEVDLMGDSSKYHIIQSHIHELDINNILGVYPTIEYNEKHNYKMSDNALKLKEEVDKKSN